MVANIKYWDTLKHKLLTYFRQGLSTLEIIKSVVISILMTIIPFYGLTTIALTTISVKFKLNLPLMLAVSYIATPLQIMLFLPFIHVGEYVFGVKHSLLNIKDIQESFETGFFTTIEKLSFELLCGLSGWILVAFPLAIITYYTTTCGLSPLLKTKCRK
ncbi:hypothetical protein Emtol_0221 (plasmid) [Emticicia oligotrophica DSM 17448]|uniref:DUF2062 domain-containing protein n=1 Tax=Emticicia oligotrophica (strain DSM 17448 / CIP 109782 / MTCC 6937 / GPTSA100-15) TaxID=929562 RepID=A0ABN4AUF3_EMTOG|nr:DUF2062 domain-containing protein [Emticicia oligotrophica]AFK05493.1 hypothetical protein Emtol_0221 [Emticicia oligotrophica DSM 17448]